MLCSDATDWLATGTAQVKVAASSVTVRSIEVARDHPVPRTELKSRFMARLPEWFAGSQAPQPEPRESLHKPLLDLGRGERAKRSFAVSPALSIANAIDAAGHPFPAGSLCTLLQR